MKTIHSIHGFNVQDEGGATTDTLTPLFEMEDVRVIEHNYPEFFRLRVRLCNRAMGMIIASIIPENSNIIAHSNGAAIVYLAAKAGAKFNHVTLVNPALDSRLAIPDANTVDVWYAPSDPWTNLARYIPWSIWGAQGRTGYTGQPDIRYRQFNQDYIFHAEMGHSGIFHDDESRHVLAQNTIERI